MGPETRRILLFFVFTKLFVVFYESTLWATSMIKKCVKVPNIRV